MIMGGILLLIVLQLEMIIFGFLIPMEGTFGVLRQKIIRIV